MIVEYYRVGHYINSYEIDKKLDELRSLYRKEIEMLIERSKEKLSEKLTEKIVEFCIESNKHKMTYSDLDRYLFEHKLKVPNILKKILYSNVNNNLEL